jgi:HEAT repeat protein
MTNIKMHARFRALGAIAVTLAIVAPQARAARQTDDEAPAVASVPTTIRLGSGAMALDPADSLYRAAREALTNGDYDRAAEMFHEVGVRYPKSALLPDAMYYEAFAKYRAGGNAEMRSARDVLASLQARFPAFGRRSDAATLATRVCGELARQGDASCAASVTAQAAVTAVRLGSSVVSPGGCATADDDDERIAALNALLQMDAERAEPILEKVLARRDPCSAPLRRKAVFLVAQKESAKAADVLLRVAQTDPDPDVRSQAVFWISQVPGERAVNVLSEIIRSSTDAELRKRAIFALGQSNSDQAAQLLREYAADATQSAALRGTAIFWLGQRGHGAQNAQFLRDLYTRLTDEQLKERVLFSLSQSSDPDRAAWLLQLAQRPSETMNARKQALFLAGQAGASIEDLAHLYDALPAGPMRDQMVFVLSQRSDPAAVDKLISIAHSDKDPEARKKALFWLGQSHDPRAIKALTEVIDR